jgi:hypothetical protein
MDQDEKALLADLVDGHRALSDQLAQLSEERIREIVREEMTTWMKRQAHIIRSQGVRYEVK